MVRTTLKNKAREENKLICNASRIGDIVHIFKREFCWLIRWQMVMKGVRLHTEEH